MDRADEDYLIFTGLGAFSAPLVATHFAQQERWSFHYLISLAIALSNFALIIGVFRFKQQDGEAPPPLLPPSA